MSTADFRTICLSFDFPAAMREVFIFGELSDWWNGLPASPRYPNKKTNRHFSFQIELPTGLYCYKLRADGHWMLDANHPRTRTCGGHQNNVLCVNGAPEPLLFAPAMPCLMVQPDGSLIVYAGLRHGFGDGIALECKNSTSNYYITIEMEKAFEEKEHRWFRARLVPDSNSLHIRFKLDSGEIIGGEDGEPFIVQPELRQDFNKIPSWWAGALIYTVFVDRFRRASDDTGWNSDPGPDRYAGGHLEGVRRSLDYLKELGINTIYLTPLTPAASCHRYDFTDLLHIDPMLGGEEAFLRLLSDVHARGMRCVVDLALTHAGRGFLPYEDVLQNGRASYYAAYFQWTEGKKPRLKSYGKRNDAPLLCLDHPEVRALALKAAKAWAMRGADGLRIDAAADVPVDLLCEIRKEVKAIAKDFAVFGEVVPGHAFRWLAQGALDAATDFGFRNAMIAFFVYGALSAERFAEQLREAEFSFGAGPLQSLRFLSTHDHPRLQSLCNRHWGESLGPVRAELAMLFLFCFPGICALVYGEEAGMASSIVALEPEDVWTERRPMPWEKSRRDEAMRVFYRKMIALRSAHKSLREGEFKVLEAREGALLIERKIGDERVCAAFNTLADSISIELEAREGIFGQPMLWIGQARRGHPKRIDIGPHSAIVLPLQI